MHGAAAALPLADVDLERPEGAPVQDKGAYLVALIVPLKKQREILIDVSYFPFRFLALDICNSVILQKTERKAINHVDIYNEIC